MSLRSKSLVGNAALLLWIVLPQFLFADVPSYTYRHEPTANATVVVQTIAIELPEGYTPIDNYIVQFTWDWITDASWPIDPLSGDSESSRVLTYNPTLTNIEGAYGGTYNVTALSQTSYFASAYISVLAEDEVGDVYVLSTFLFTGGDAYRNVAVHTITGAEDWNIN